MKWHILPINDSREHIESEKCECNPKVKIINGHKVIIHNSYDGRENIEKEIARCVKIFRDKE